MLDPQFKDNFFSSTSSCESAKVLLQDEFQSGENNDDLQEPATKIVAIEDVTTSNIWVV